MVRQDSALNLINKTIEKSMRIGDDIVPEEMKKQVQERLASSGSQKRETHVTLKDLLEKKKSL